MVPLNQRSLVFNGRHIILPIGLRFLPTDELLIELYLKRKVFDLPIPISAIPDFDVFLADPWDLPGDLKEKRYFFTKQSSFSRKSAGCGIWKSVGEQSFVVNNGFNQVIGLKKTLVFSEIISTSSPTTAAEPEWVMHEYRLPSPVTKTKKVESRDWAVYCLFQKKEKPNQWMEEDQIMDLTVEEDSSSSASSSCSSGVTEISFIGEDYCTDQEEISSRDFDFSSS